MEIISQSKHSIMKNFFLLTFNPRKWPGGREGFLDELHTFQNGGLELQWSIQAHRQAKVGDYCFFLVQGVEPRGIYGGGRIIEEPFVDENWNGNGRPVHYVGVEVEIFTDYQTPLITLDRLKRIDAKYDWSPRNGGRPMPTETALKVMETIKK